MKEFHLPDLGEGLQEAEIVTWHVAEGERVVTDQPLLSVETDKAVVDVPSPYSGIIASLGAKEGDVVEVGAILVEYAEDEVQDTGTVVGSLAPHDENASKKPGVTSRATGTAASTAPRPESRSGARAKASPSVRALARKLGVDLESISATGKHGNVTAEDVASAGHGSSSRGPGEPLRGMRRAMAKRMSHSHSRVVPAFASDESDIGSWPEGVDISARITRAIVVGCRAEPGLNAWFDDEVLTLTLHERVNLGVAVDSEHGLFVPVLENVDQKNAEENRATLQTLIEEVHSRSLSPEALTGATLTFSNYGALGISLGQMVIVPPQVAIIGTGRIRESAAVVDGEIKVTRVLPVSLTFDHRVVTGGEAARFLLAVIEDLRKAL